jgi:mannose-6-phosphate isomerase
MTMKKKVDKRPWGEFEQFTLNERSTVKVLTVKPGKRNSLQRHRARAEFWKIIDGPIRVTVGKKSWNAKTGDEISVGKGVLHRYRGLKKSGRILEISFGKFDEKDIVRIEDDYGRA